MRKYGIEKVAELLENGRQKLETGRSEDGLIDLRSAIEIFLVEILKMIGNKPHSQDKVKQNIEVLEKSRYLDGKMKGLLIKILHNSIYDHISDKAAHKREPCYLDDSRYIFDLTDDTFNYLIEKISPNNFKDKSNTER